MWPDADLEHRGQRRDPRVTVCGHVHGLASSGSSAQSWGEPTGPAGRSPHPRRHLPRPHPAQQPHSPDLVRGLRMHLNALPEGHRQHPGPHLERWGTRGQGRGLRGEPRTRGYAALWDRGLSSPLGTRGPPQPWVGPGACPVGSLARPTAPHPLACPPPPPVPRHLHVGMWEGPLSATPSSHHTGGV